MALTARPATADDAPAIARIFNEGIDDRIATFETAHRDADDVLAWIVRGEPLAVVVDEPGALLGWAHASPYGSRPCYDGVRELSVYVARSARGRGAGRLAVEALLAACERDGAWKLVSRSFAENAASRALCRSLGFREVGVYHRHARLDGRWRDCVIVERLLPAAEA